MSTAGSLQFYEIVLYHYVGCIKTAEDGRNESFWSLHMSMDGFLLVAMNAYKKLQFLAVEFISHHFQRIKFAIPALAPQYSLFDHTTF